MIGSHRRETRLCGYGEGMGTWYWIGVCVGIGVAVGVFHAGFWGTGRESAILVTLSGLVIGFLAGWVISDWQPGSWAIAVRPSRAWSRPARSGPRRRRRPASRRHTRRHGHSPRRRGARARWDCLHSGRRLPRRDRASPPCASAPSQAARALRGPAHAREGLMTRRHDLARPARDLAHLGRAGPAAPAEPATAARALRHVGRFALLPAARNVRRGAQGAPARPPAQAI